VTDTVDAGVGGAAREPAVGAVAAPEIVGRRAKRIRHLDGWRGMSLICVLIGHFGQAPGLKIGPLGVELFFVLSGRLMAEILFVEKFPLKRFYARRFSRIYPAMAVFAVIAFLVLLKTPLKFHPAFVATDLTFTYNYFAAIGHHRTDANDHIWSLCVEEHAYILLGLIALASRARRLAAAPTIALLAAASMLDGAVSRLLGQSWFDAYWRTDSHVASVLVSATVYLATRRTRWLETQAGVALLSPVCLLLGVLLFADAFGDPFSYTAGTTLLAIAVCTLDVAPRALRGLLSSPPIVWVGVLSYSIYLWQQPFYAAIFLAPPEAGRSLLLLAGAIAAGAASFYLLEQPARRILNRRLAGEASPTAELAARPAE
jgi:peptidoglycan/LPS O-acetylase OafA/YrhL